MNKAVKIFFIIIALFNSTSFSKDILKAKIGVKWDSDNKEYTAEGDVTYENEDIKIFSQYLKAKYEMIDDKEIFNQIDVKDDVKIIFNDETYRADYGSYEKSTEIRGTRLNGSWYFYVWAIRLSMVVVAGFDTYSRCFYVRLFIGC